MSRNYGLGSRVMADAGRLVLFKQAEIGGLSFGSAATVAQRWNRFCTFAKAQGVSRMETITRDFVLQYGQHLANQVKTEKLAVATAQNLLSAVNTVLNLIPEKNWLTVSPTEDCALPARSFIRQITPIGNQNYRQAAKALEAHPREQSLLLLCREFGLRSEEASLLNPDEAFRQSLSENLIHIDRGTKGGRKRTVPITNERQRLAIHIAMQAKSSQEKCLIPKGMSYKGWRNGPMRHAREVLKSFGATGLHDLRAAYACERYKVLTGKDAPVFTGHRTVPKLLDNDARMTISKELGHSRLDITSAYIGSMK